MIDDSARSPSTPCMPRRRLVFGFGLVLTGCAQPYITGGPLYGGPEPSAQQPVATLHVQGRVEVVHDGRIVPGYDGMPLYLGDDVRTYSDSYARCVFQDGDAVWLDHDTRVRMGSVFTFFGRVFASVSGIFQVDSEFVAASSEGTEYTVTIARDRPYFSVAVRDGIVLCRPRRGDWRPLALRPGERLVGIGLATPRIDLLDARESAGEFEWVPSTAPTLRFRFPERSRTPRREPSPPRQPSPQDSAPPSPSRPTAPTRPSGPVRRPSGGIIERLERTPTPPKEPVLR